MSRTSLSTGVACTLLLCALVLILFDHIQYHEATTLYYYLYYIHVHTYVRVKLMYIYVYVYWCSTVLYKVYHQQIHM